MTALTDKIIELVPGIEEHVTVAGRFTTPVRRPITLADVLRAIGKGNKQPTIDLLEEPDCMRIWVHGIGWAVWNLSTDLDGQSDETKAFLSKVLGV